MDIYARTSHNRTSHERQSPCRPLTECGHEQDTDTRMFGTLVYNVPQVVVELVPKFQFPWQVVVDQAEVLWLVIVEQAKMPQGLANSHLAHLHALIATFSVCIASGGGPDRGARGPALLQSGASNLLSHVLLEQAERPGGLLRVNQGHTFAESRTYIAQAYLPFLHCRWWWSRQRCKMAWRAAIRGAHLQISNARYASTPPYVIWQVVVEQTE
eukprot:scaffold30926_cov17-Tisochrysis_lutea.AAC.1